MRKSHIKLDSLRWVSQRRSPMPPFCGVHTQGSYDPKFELGRYFFVQCAYPLSFIILCLVFRKLSCWQTNKQTDTAKNIQRSSLCYDVGQSRMNRPTRRRSNRTTYIRSRLEVIRNPRITYPSTKAALILYKSSSWRWGTRTWRDVSSYLFTYLPLNYDTPVVP